MKAIPYTHARGQFASIMDEVCEDHSTIIITRQKQKSVIMMSLEDYNSLEETLYLLKSPKNAARLNKAIKQIEVRETINHEIIE